MVSFSERRTKQFCKLNAAGGAKLCVPVLLIEGCWQWDTYPLTLRTNSSTFLVVAMGSKFSTLGLPYAPMSTYISSLSPLGWTMPGLLGNVKGHSHSGYSWKTNQNTQVTSSFSHPWSGVCCPSYTSYRRESKSAKMKQRRSHRTQVEVLSRQVEEKKTHRSRQH